MAQRYCKNNYWHKSTLHSQADGLENINKSTGHVQTIKPSHAPVKHGSLGMKLIYIPGNKIIPKITQKNHTVTLHDKAVEKDDK